MAKLVGTVARVNAKTGIWDHKHDDFGWHWASAGHRDAGETHLAAKAATPTFVEGTSDVLKAGYLKALNRQQGAVSQIAGKANEGKGVYVKAVTLK